MRLSICEQSGDDIDLSKIARHLFDGGGHAKAAGGRLNRHFAGNFREI